MSHIVTIATEVRDATAVQTACRRLGLAEPAHDTVELFAGEVTGLAIQLPNWTYPIVCSLATGQVQYDNFQGTCPFYEEAWTDASGLAEG